MNADKVIKGISQLCAAYRDIPENEILIAVIGAEARIEAAKIIANKINEHYTAMADIADYLNKMQAKM